MKFEVMPRRPRAEPHRGQPFKSFIHCDEDFSIKDIEVVILELEAGQWWIAPENIYDEKDMADIGPFETPELAWSTLMLLKD